MPTKVPMPGLGGLQWDTIGWFCFQLFGTAWILAFAIILALKLPLVAAWCATCFAFANTACTWLWLRRDRVRPHTAVQGLLAACGIAGLLAVAALHISRRGEGDPLGFFRSTYFALLVMLPALMVCFALTERAARKNREA
jgi:hypothetical protein